MSNYQQYGGNPYGQAEQGYGQPQGQSNPYGGGYGSSNPYGGGYDEQPAAARPSQPQHADSNYSQPSQYSQQQPGAGLLSGPPTNAPGGPSSTSAVAPPPEQLPSQPLSQADFLARIDGAKQRIALLTSDIATISTIHQRMLSSSSASSSAELEGIITSTQVRNTGIKDEIKFLERDAARDPSSFKKSQVKTLKTGFEQQLREFQAEESSYGKRYREAIGRQYRIINPDATEAEVQEAQNADWGDEGVFSQALKSNRTGQATSVLSSVRARHNDIERIARTMAELNTLFQQLAAEVEAQEVPVQKIEQQTQQVNDDAKGANDQLDAGIVSARRARKLKWWTLGVVVLIIAILALVLGIYFGTGQNKK